MDFEYFILWKRRLGFVSIPLSRSEEDIEALPVKLTALTSQGCILPRFAAPLAQADAPKVTTMITSHCSKAEGCPRLMRVWSALAIRMSGMVRIFDMGQ
jgi:hypothetical protein